MDSIGCNIHEQHDNYKYSTLGMPSKRLGNSLQPAQASQGCSAGVTFGYFLSFGQAVSVAIELSYGVYREAMRARISGFLFRLIWLLHCLLFGLMDIGGAGTQRAASSHHGGEKSDVYCT